MPPTIFSNHAPHMMMERGIQREWVEGVLQAPEWIEPDPRASNLIRAFGGIGEAGGKVLRVVYTDSGDERRVITVFFDRDAVKPSGQSR